MSAYSKYLNVIIGWLRGHCGIAEMRLGTKCRRCGTHEHKGHIKNTLNRPQAVHKTTPSPNLASRLEYTGRQQVRTNETTPSTIHYGLAQQILRSCPSWIAERPPTRDTLPSCHWFSKTLVLQEWGVPIRNSRSQYMESTPQNRTQTFPTTIQTTYHYTEHCFELMIPWSPYNALLRFFAKSNFYSPFPIPRSSCTYFHGLHYHSLAFYTGRPHCFTDFTILLSAFVEQSYSLHLHPSYIPIVNFTHLLIYCVRDELRSLLCSLWFVIARLAWTTCLQYVINK